GLLVPGSAALDQDQIKITSSHDWITAGPGTGTDETATITVVIDNESFINESVKVDEVLFSCANEFLYNGAGSKIGDLSSSKVSETQYEATFHSKKSGDATIQVNVKYTVDKVEGGPFERSNDTVQRVDHAMPYAFEYLDYDTEITVNTDTDITLQMIDKYGNVVDSRKEDSLVPVKNAEGVRFQCSSETDAGFWKDESTLTNDITKFVDSKGNLSVKFKASSSAGANPVNLICVTAVPKMLITIYGEGESTPASMTTSVDPSSRCVPGDGESTFTIVYQLFDQFGNPSPNSPLYIHTSIDGEERNVFTNEDGYAILTYGPKTSIGLVTFYADSRLTPTVRDDVELRFTSSDGTWFEAYSNPSDLSSYEVKPFTNGTIYARVTDNVGRGVWNEKISFRINASSIENQTAAPMMDPKIYNPASDSWEDSSVDILTDEYGYAEVPFRSGEFPDQDAENFDPSSSGSCKVTVTWDRSDEPDQIKEVKVTWRNYPYIRAETEVSSSSIRPGDTFDVTIRLIGDGFAIRQHLPVDVVLLLDRSED
ncbi:hypothetical protein, partial [Methanocalculus sp.]|uniref:hypothetical protein n=1 Tax=Methanocalculus sp. TaxID=2004547 RepID=UPI002624F8B0